MMSGEPALLSSHGLNGISTKWELLMVPDEILDDLEFEEKIRALPDRELIEFNARQLFLLRKDYQSVQNRLKRLENRDRKFYGIIGATGTFVGAIIVSGIEYIRKN